MVGTWMQGMVQAWLVYRLSHSASWLGFISFSTQLPAFLMSPVAGVLADRGDRRKILIWVQVVAMTQALLLATLVFAGKIELWHVAVLSVVLGLANAFELTTRHAIAGDLVGKADLHSAIACNSIIINGSRILGPALAGVLIAPLGEGWCFLLNGLSYLAVIYGLWIIHLEQHKHFAGSRNPLAQIRGGIQYVQNSPRIRRFLAASTFMSFFGFGYAVLMPVFAKDILHGDARVLGWLTGAAGAGAILGALGLSQAADPEQTERRVYRNLLLIGASLILLGVSRNLALSLGATFGVGFFLMGTFPSLNTAIQQMVDDSVRGRVLSLYTMSFLGAVPLGNLLAGGLADRIGASWVEIASGSVFLIAGVALNCIYSGNSVESRATNGNLCPDKKPT